MSWVPPDLGSTCPIFATITTCQPSTFMFLQLIASLFGRSRDEGFNNRLVNDFVYTRHEVDDLASSIYGSEEKISGDASSEFDFIVIGAGTAGCVIANRLTEVSEWNVLLLEAGEEEPDVASVPAFTPMLRGSSLDWEFRTQPQLHSCTARPEGRCTWPRGRVVGGTSVINSMIYLRGSPMDYDEWEQLGNPGWSYKDILPYFIRTEQNGNADRVNSQFHGVNGDWPVEYFPFQDDNVFYLLEGFRELGLDIFDQNGIRQIGASLMQHTTRDGQRVSANVAFIRPIRIVRKNLFVRSNAFVTRVLINPLTKTAYGVEYTQNGEIRRATARKEVIISAGVMNSPKILMLSGVGPREHLEELRIRVIQDLRVGNNLHDHTTIDGLVMALSNITATQITDNQRTQDVQYYRETHRGSLSGTSTVQVNAFIQTSYERDPDRPDIQYSMDAADVQNFLTDPILSVETNVLPVAYYNGLNIRPVLLAPKSRGVLRLNSTHPVTGPPLIYANTFTESIDLVRMLEGIRFGINLIQTKTLQEIGASLVSQPMAACSGYEFNTDDYWICVCTSYTTTLYHPVGTCKMAPRTDPDAVVNHELKVYGIRNLRVIDGSIIPIVPRANTNTATIMIADKGCDMIKAEWLNRKASKNFSPFAGIIRNLLKKKFLI